MATKYSDGTASTTTYDDMGNPTAVKQLDADGHTVAETDYHYTDAGKLQSTDTVTDSGRRRTTTMAWDGAGRTTGTATNGRASHATYDIAGRMKTSKTGGGTAAEVPDADTYESHTNNRFAGALPIESSVSEPKNGLGKTYASSAQHNANGDVVDSQVGEVRSQQRYDQFGHVTSATAPGRTPTNYSVDARGAVKEETLPDGAKNHYGYDPSGAQTNYTDLHPRRRTRRPTSQDGRCAARTRTARPSGSSGKARAFTRSPIARAGPRRWSTTARASSPTSAAARWCSTTSRTTTPGVWSRG